MRTSPSPDARLGSRRWRSPPEGRRTFECTGVGAEYRSGGTEDRHVALAVTAGSTPDWVPLRLRAPTRALRQSPDGVGGAGATKGSPSHQTAPEAPLRQRRGASGLLPRPVPARTALSRRGTPLQSCSRSSGDMTRDRRHAATWARRRTTMLGAIEPVERARPGGSVRWSAEIRSESGGRGDSARRVRTCADSLHHCLLDRNHRLDGVSFRPFRHHRRVSCHLGMQMGCDQGG